YAPHSHLPSFPTRRSSDLAPQARSSDPRRASTLLLATRARAGPAPLSPSTRANPLPRRRSPPPTPAWSPRRRGRRRAPPRFAPRSEEHTSELQSLAYLVGR